MRRLTFINNTTKTAQANIVKRKHVIMNSKNFIYNFWMTVFYFALPALQLHLEMLIMIMCQRRSQLQKNKEILLNLTKKK